MPSEAFGDSEGRVMNCGGNIFILYWQVSAVSATEPQLACRCLPLLTLLFKRRAYMISFPS